MKHEHDFDCMDFYPSGLGGWLGVCEVNGDRIYVTGGTPSCTINRPHKATECNGEHLSIEDA
jgi:hypothetical protein